MFEVCLFEVSDTFPIFWLLSSFPWVNFIKACKAFTHVDPKSAKNTVKLSVLFVILGYLHVKALHTMLVKLTPYQNLSNIFPIFLFASEEVILNEDRTTEEERRYIMEARKRALQKRKKLRTLGKSRSTESEDEEMEEEEGKDVFLYS